MKVTLADIVDNKRAEVEQRRSARSSEMRDNLARAVVAAPGNFIRRTSQRRVNLIAEIKPRSPSAGVLRGSAKTDVYDIVDCYGRHASAISVLTDEKYFGGSLSLLEKVHSRSPLPVLCKDFIIDEVQILEARAAGADAVLLIAKILDAAHLQKLQVAAQQLNMTALVEVQNEHELDAALSANAEILLINNRDLSTFEIDLNTTARLARLIPRTVPFVSASGIESASDIERLLPYTNRFLVGSSIMKAKDMEAKLSELAGIGVGCSPDNGRTSVAVKVCGITRSEDALLAISLGASHIGLIFAPTSPRYVQLEQARAICDAVRGKAKIVGVFQNQAHDVISHYANALKLDAVQYHGDERSDELAFNSASTNGPAIVKTLADAQPLSITSYQRHVDLLLFDRPKGSQLSAQDWLSQLEAVIRPGLPACGFFIAGGLTAQNVSAAISCFRSHPAFVGVDVASGVESLPGIKDSQKLHSFFAAVDQGVKHATSQVG